jgi:hypothetical protein
MKKATASLGTFISHLTDTVDHLDDVAEAIAFVAGAYRKILESCPDWEPATWEANLQAGANSFINSQKEEKE